MILLLYLFEEEQDVNMTMNVLAYVIPIISTDIPEIGKSAKFVKNFGAHRSTKIFTVIPYQDLKMRRNEAL